MGFWGSIGNAFKKFGKLIAAGFKWASEHGLTDALVQEALGYVRLAETMFIDNTEKREWVVGKLVSIGIPESIARLAVELAVQAFHKEVDSHIPA